MKIPNRLIGLLLLIIAQIAFVGYLFDMPQLFQVAVLNGLLLIVFLIPLILSYFGIKKKELLHTIQHRVKDYGVTLGVITAFLLLGVSIIRGSSLTNTVIISILTGAGALRTQSKNLHRGKHKIHVYDLGLRLGIGVALILLTYSWSEISTVKYFIAMGGGLIAYSLFSLQKTKKSPFRTLPSRILFAGITVISGVRAGVQTGMERVDDHTIEKVVYEEKIVYVPVEKEEETESIVLNTQEENNTGEFQSANTESGGNTVREEEGSEEELQLCNDTQCLFGGECVEKPAFARCDGDTEFGRICDDEYVEDGGTCITKEDYRESIQEEEIEKEVAQNIPQKTVVTPVVRTVRRTPTVVKENVEEKNEPITLTLQEEPGAISAQQFIKYNTLLKGDGSSAKEEILSEEKPVIEPSESEPVVEAELEPIAEPIIEPIPTENSSPNSVGSSVPTFGTQSEELVAPVIVPDSSKVSGISSVGGGNPKKEEVSEPQGVKNTLENIDTNARSSIN